MRQRGADADLSCAEDGVCLVVKGADILRRVVLDNHGTVVLQPQLAHNDVVNRCVHLTHVYV